MVAEPLAIFDQHGMAHIADQSLLALVAGGVDVLFLVTANANCPQQWKGAYVGANVECYGNYNCAFAGANGTCVQNYGCGTPSVAVNASCSVGNSGGLFGLNGLCQTATNTDCITGLNVVCSAS